MTVIEIICRTCSELFKCSFGTATFIKPCYRSVLCESHFLLRYRLLHSPGLWPLLLTRINRWPVNSLHKGEWRGSLTFSLICAWLDGWVNNREAGDSRRLHSHYDVTIMGLDCPPLHCGFMWPVGISVFRRLCWLYYLTGGKWLPLGLCKGDDESMTMPIMSTIWHINICQSAGS